MLNKFQKSLETTIDEMRSVAEQLVAFSFPKVPFWEEIDIDVLKMRRITVDGYDVFVHLGKSDYGTCFIETLEISSCNSPFLPMFLVCKLAMRFLGGHDLKYAESLQSGRKRYIWTIALDERGRPLPIVSDRVEKRNYEGFEYCCLANELLTER